MNRKRGRRTKLRRPGQSRKSGLNYQSLEPRQLLAQLFMGTAGNDNAHVTYVDANHVNVLINDVLHENVDSTNGIRINPLGRSHYH